VNQQPGILGSIQPRRVGLSSPFEFQNEVIVSIFAFGKDSSQAVTSHMEHSIGHAKDPAWILQVSILQPCIKAVQVLAIEKFDRAVLWGDRFGRLRGNRRQQGNLQHESAQQGPFRHLSDSEAG
jgi:hypothetical protein